MKKVKWAVIILNLVYLLYFAYKYIIVQKIGVIPFFAVKTSAIFILVMTAGIILNSRTLMSVSIPGLLMYGTRGLFIPLLWEHEPILQYNNILITISIVYMLFAIIRKFAVIRFVIGAIAGIILVAGLNYYYISIFKEANRIYPLTLTHELERYQTSK